MNERLAQVVKDTGASSEFPAGAIYTGHVVHKRLRPKPHALDYRVFSLLLDVDKIDEVASRTRLFSRNAPNVVSFYDKDFGAGDGQDVAVTSRQLLVDAGLAEPGQKILLLAYPRVFGYVFNPISVFYVLDHAGKLAVVVYEVSNTFGERMSYILPAGRADNGVFAHGCEKRLFVSPFASRTGVYSFRATVPDSQLKVAVLVRDEDGPLIKTHFRADQGPLTDAGLVKALVRHPAMTWKVMAGIHYEALKLWLKGVPVVSGHHSPRYSVSFPSARRG